MFNSSSAVLLARSGPRRSHRLSLDCPPPKRIPQSISTIPQSIQRISQPQACEPRSISMPTTAELLEHSCKTELVITAQGSRNHPMRSLKLTVLAKPSPKRRDRAGKGKLAHIPKWHGSPVRVCWELISTTLHHLAAFSLMEGVRFSGIRAGPRTLFPQMRHDRPLRSTSL